MALHPKQIEAVLALDGPSRYDHFIKEVVGRDEVWGLYKDGWVTAGTDDGGDVVFPLWPAEDYAALCAEGDWADTKPTSIPLDVFIDELLPNLERDGVLPGVFFTPSHKCVTPEVAQLLADIKNELKRYE